MIVNLKDNADTAIKGVLWSTRGRWLVVVDASVLETNAPPTHLDGEVVIDRDNVAFIQVLP